MGRQFPMMCRRDVLKSLEDRILRNNRGQVKYIASRLPVEVVHKSIFPCRWPVYQFEVYLKSGSGRVFAKRHFI